MCGISVVVEFGGSAPSMMAALSTMHDMQAHRGPDGEGLMAVDTHFEASGHPHRESRVALRHEYIHAAAAFRWLKIQDLDESSSQPMQSADGGLWLLFNGEIYNFQEIRSELVAAGCQFHTASDTEVILAAYAIWGTDCFAKFVGMWGLVLFDVNRRKLVISRDRLGIKPLFYSWDKSRLLVASEPHAIAMARREGPYAELFRLDEFLRGLPPQSAELSFFRDVHPVPAGTWAELALNVSGSTTLVFRRYWDLAQIKSHDLHEDEFERWREQFEALLLMITREHSRAAVEVGATLSGGIDSSLLTRFLADHARQLGRRAVQTFSIVYRDPRMSEWPFMQLVLAQGGLTGRNFLLTPEAAWRSAAAVIAAQGKPLLGQDAIAQYHVYRLAREHGCTVVLDGQGADELLAGLPQYDAEQFPDWLAHGRWFKVAVELRARMQRYDLRLSDAWREYVAAPRRVARMRWRGANEYDWLVPVVADASTTHMRHTMCASIERPTALSRFLHRHVVSTNLPTVLLAQDHNSMRHQIESRVPFVDHRLVELCFRFPDSYKVSHGIRKRILMETAKRYLPHQIISRRDKRMFISRRSWMQLRETRTDELQELIHSADLTKLSLINADNLRRFITDFLDGAHSDEMAIWRIFTCMHWLNIFKVST